tara:strand:- start:185 stop:583 length:399 start_codon:yes stop_codon:yes gene_type:complete
MENALDQKLYMKAKKIADDTYKRPSAYKSMFISKKYKELGGKFKNKGTGKLSKWIEEEWIQVLPYLESGKKVVCGSGANKKGCRPFKKINSNTPMTINELIKKHGKTKLLELAKLKRKNMNTRINWTAGRKY